ncbi:MAG: Nucleotide sugar dehydrogenase [Candidatus Moranbacteria bacterium GW2011_GWE2_47_10]|nr:MAG: Nucleotide sugar dehydrogenase [Candidatus Moranbacteria bacterium GW2011_GWE2_47_10]
MYKIMIIGSGFVGQATGKSFAKLGHGVTFCDTDSEKLNDLKKEGFEISSPENIGRAQADIFFLTVSTPTVNKKIKMDFILAAVKNLAQKALRVAKNRPLVVVKSTVPPGTTENVIAPLLEKYSGKKSGKDFFAAMNPEYLRERVALEDFENPRLVLIGANEERARKILSDLYAPYEDKCPIAFLSPTGAEMQKYTHNLWNAAKISYFNEMRAVAKKMELDADKIFELTMKSAEASWNSAYGTKDFGPFGGSCLPKDTSAFLKWSKEQLDMDLPLLRSVISVNDALVEKITTEKEREKIVEIKTLSPIFYLEPKKIGVERKINFKHGFERE